jgi:hypothetical protein
MLTTWPSTKSTSGFCRRNSDLTSRLRTGRQSSASRKVMNLPVDAAIPALRAELTPALLWCRHSTLGCWIEFKNSAVPSVLPSLTMINSQSCKDCASTELIAVSRYLMALNAGVMTDTRGRLEPVDW